MDEIAVEGCVLEFAFGHSCSYDETGLRTRQRHDNHYDTKFKKNIYRLRLHVLGASYR